VSNLGVLSSDFGSDSAFVLLFSLELVLGTSCSLEAASFDGEVDTSNRMYQD